MNRAKAEQITDRILARMEQDGDGRGPVAHKDSITDEIVAASDEIIDVIWRDDDGVWKHRDGTPFDMDADVKQASRDGKTGVGLLKEMSDRAAELLGLDKQILIDLDGVHPETRRLLAEYGVCDKDTA